MPDPASCIRFIFLSFKEGIDHSVQNRTGSDLDGLVRCWFNASGLEASWCARNIRPGSGKTQPARYQFPTFRLSCVLPQMAQFILCKAILGPVWFWLNGSSLEASWCAKITMPGLAECNQHACYQFPTFRLGCILPQTAWVILCKASLDPVWFWLHASGLEASWCVRIIRPGSGRTQPAHYQFSTFRLSCVLPQTAWVTLCKASLDPIWFRLDPIWFRLNPIWFRLTASSFGQMDPVWKQAGVQESPVNTRSNQCFQADLDQM